MKEGHDHDMEVLPVLSQCVMTTKSTPKSTTTTTAKQGKTAVSSKQLCGHQSSTSNPSSSSLSSYGHSTSSSYQPLTIQTIHQHTMSLLDEASKHPQSQGFLSVRMPVLSSPNMSSTSTSSNATTDWSSIQVTSVSFHGESEIDKSFSLFVDFVGKLSEGSDNECEASVNHKTQESLRLITLPLMVHCFVHLFENGHRAAAKRFFNKHSHLLTTVNKSSHSTITSSSTPPTHQTSPSTTKAFESIIKKMTILSNSINAHSIINTSSEVSDETKEIKELKSYRSVVQLPEEARNLLLKYLEDSKDMVLNQMIHGFISTVSLDHKTNDYQSTPGSLKKSKAALLSSPTLLPKICLYTFSGVPVSAADISPPLSQIAIGVEEKNEIQVFQVDQHKTNPEGPKPDIIDGNEQKIILRGHGGTIFDLAFLSQSSEDSFLLSCSQDSSARLWNLRGSESSCIAIYPNGHYPHPIWTLDISPLNLYFATGSRDTTVKLWSTEYLYPLRIFAGHTLDVDTVKFHPNCKYLASGSSDKTLRLWSVNNGDVIRMLPGHKAAISAVSFTPDGQYVVSACDDKKIRFFDIRTSKLLRELRGHTNVIKDLTFNETGSLMISSSLDGTIKAWDMTSLIKTLGGDAGQPSTSQGTPSSTSSASYPSTGNRPVLRSRLEHGNVLLSVCKGD